MAMIFEPGMVVKIISGKYEGEVSTIRGKCECGSFDCGMFRLKYDELVHHSRLKLIESKKKPEEWL